MKPFQQRVINEKHALDSQLNLLLDFIGGDAFDALPTPEKSRLVTQGFAMNEYSSILGERLLNFGRS